MSGQNLVKEPFYELSSTDTKKGAIGKDGSVDSEVGEISPDTTLQTPLQYVTKTLDCSDDPTLNCYTFRAFFLGAGLACFGAVIAEIFYFKPQTVTVNAIFLQIIAYVLGEVMSFIPRWGKVGRSLNPGNFNMKEHVFITIMATSASVCALGTEQLAVQALYYDENPNGASAIFMLFSSQMLGYGMIGTMRKLFVYPTKFVWPLQLPHASLFQSLHLDKAIAKKRLRVFWWVCGAVIIWEIIPEYIFPLTAGISIFCLADQNSAAFTYLFGGANGDEGLGFLSWCMDWEYIGTNIFVIPLNTLGNQLIGYLGCIVLTTVIYWANMWNAENFPFMAQGLYLANGSSYDQTQILGADNKVDKELLAAYGVPWFSTSNAMSLCLMNMAVTAAIVHILLWNWDDVKKIFLWATPSALKESIHELRTTDKIKFWKKDGSHIEKFPGTEDDPHFAAMQNYKETPGWWYSVVLVIALVIGLICTYQQKTGLPWATIPRCMSALLPPTCLLRAVVCSNRVLLPASQRRTDDWFIYEARLSRRQYDVYALRFKLHGTRSAHAGRSETGAIHQIGSESCVLAQMLGTAIGAILNWVMMNSIVKNQRAVLLSAEDTNIWSGQNVQTYNAQAVAWGGTGPEIFGINGTYYMVPIGLAIGVFVPVPFYIAHKYWPKLRFNEINTYIISIWLGWLSVGINSSLLPHFCFGVFSQGYLRRYRPAFFAKYMIIIAAAIGGGVQIIVFVLTFAVFGGSGKSHDFPVWWGNNLDGNVDRCKYMG